MQSRTVPSRVFHAEQQKYTGMFKSQQIGRQLAREHPEIIDWYTDYDIHFTAREVAQKLIPEAYEISPEVAKRAVVYVLHLLLTEEKRAKVTSKRRSIGAKRQWNFSGPEWREHCRRAATARYRKKIPVYVTAMLHGKGRTPWAEIEEALLIQLIDHPNYKKATGRCGRDYEKIAETLNGQFHTSKLVRTANTARRRATEIKRFQARRANRKLPII